MRIASGGTTYVVRPDAHGWILATVRVRGEDSKHAGQEYEADVKYPGTFPGALRSLLDRMVRDGHSPDWTLEQAVNTVAHLYAHIGESAGVSR